MNKRTIWTLAVLIAIAIILVWTSKMKTKEPVVEQGATEQNQGQTVVFYDQATGEKTSATFSGQSVTFMNEKIGTVTLPQTISASGARYADENESIVFWNKGNDLFITQDGKIIFNGSIGEPNLPAENNSTSSGDDKISYDSSKVKDQTWVWVKTQMNDDSVVTPKKVNTFTIKFLSNGNINGTTDCNGFFGPYKIDNSGRIDSGPLASTLMYCEGSQEGVFRKAIEDSKRFMLDKDGNLVLMLPYDSGSVIFKKK